MNNKDEAVPAGGKEETALAGDVVCPLWDTHDRRLVARHYAAWKRNCRRCGREVVVSRLQKQQADAGKLTFLCEQCDLTGNAK